MRELSLSQASACEHAQTARCRCRCGGQFHGASRGAVEELPLDDPHHPGDQLELELATPTLDVEPSPAFR